MQLRQARDQWEPCQSCKATRTVDTTVELLGERGEADADCDAGTDASHIDDEDRCHGREGVAGLVYDAHALRSGQSQRPNGAAECLVDASLMGLIERRRIRDPRF